jgi:hypothetical protein
MENTYVYIDDQSQLGFGRIIYFRDLNDCIPCKYGRIDSQAIWSVLN